MFTYILCEFEYGYQGQFYQVEFERAKTAFNAGMEVYKYYRGMSTKEVQKSWNTTLPCSLTSWIQTRMENSTMVRMDLDSITPWIIWTENRH